MADTSTPSKSTQRQVKAAAWLDEKLERRAVLRALKLAENRRYEDGVKFLKEQRNTALDGVDQEIDAIDTELAAFVRGRLYWLLRWFSKTIRRPAGVISVVSHGPKLEMPADVGPVTDALERIPGGDRYIRIIKEPDLLALGQAPESVLRQLGSLGVQRVPHDTILVKSPSDTKATQIARWQARERTRRSTPKRQ